METHNERKARKAQEDVVNKMNRSVADEGSRKATEKQASVQDEFITESGEEGAKMSKKEGVERKAKSRYDVPDQLEEDYNEVYNPSGMNTERQTADRKPRNRKNKIENYEDDDLQERSLKGKRSKAGNRHGASPRDYEEERKASRSKTKPFKEE